MQQQPETLMSLTLTRLKTSEFQTLSSLVYSECGIHLSEAKKVMLESRLQKRLRVLGMTSFKNYIEFVSSKEGIENELVHMIDVVTTNKTDFFREPNHFEYMKERLLPEFADATQFNRPLTVWSSACSTGEEPYTLAMVFQDFASLHGRFSYSILASDISTQVLQKASLAVYNAAYVNILPTDIKKKYFLKSKDQEKPTARVVSGIREKVDFFRFNLMDNEYDVEGNLDIIFCRNVLIYFDRATQQKVVSKLAQKLKPGGHLFIGHSESLHQFDLPLTQVKPTIFIKK